MGKPLFGRGILFLQVVRKSNNYLAFFVQGEGLKFELMVEIISIKIYCLHDEHDLLYFAGTGSSLSWSGSALELSSTRHTRWSFIFWEAAVPTDTQGTGYLLRSCHKSWIVPDGTWGTLEPANRKTEELCGHRSQLEVIVMSSLGGQKLRLLCLHGHRQSGQLFRAKLGGFRKMVRRWFNFLKNYWFRNIWNISAGEKSCRFGLYDGATQDTWRRRGRLYLVINLCSLILLECLIRPGGRKYSCNFNFKWTLSLFLLFQEQFIIW